jgi:hypothetical protein
MQVIGSFGLQEQLGSSPAGRVWRATDPFGKPVTIAVLEGGAAADQQQRWLFMSAIERIRAGRGGAGPVAADLGAALPWVAFPEDGGPGAAAVFVEMGAGYAGQPTGLPGQPGQPAQPGLLGGPPIVQPGQPYGQPPSIGAQGGPAPVSGMPLSGPPVVSGPPSSPAPFQQSPYDQPPYEPSPHDPNAAAGPDGSDQPPAEVSPIDPFGPPPPNTADPYAAPVFVPGPGEPGHQGPRQQVPAPQGPDRRNLPAPVDGLGPYQPNRFVGNEQPPARRRTGLIIALVAALVVVLGGGGTAAALALRGSGDKGTGQHSASPSQAKHSSSPAGQATPTAPKSAPSTPKQPGKEPPKNGSWPANWPGFAAADHAQPQADLAGLGFTFDVPAGWTCTKVDQSTGYVNYHCGNDAQHVGGDVIVRRCGEPCDAAKKIKMRQGEEAWGLQWVRDGGNSSWATSNQAPGSDGKPGFGLVLVRYWHSSQGGPLDRQVVVRMTAPAAQAATVQKTANSVRAATQ